jgi:hypothetical protein
VHQVPHPAKLPVARRSLTNELGTVVMDDALLLLCFVANF